jgi:hypothetical protein
MSDGAGAGAMECRTGPIACIREGVTHHRSTVSCSPNSLATLPTDRPLVATRSTASRLKACGNIRRIALADTLLLARKPSIGVRQTGGGSNDHVRILVEPEQMSVSGASASDHGIVAEGRGAPEAAIPWDKGQPSSVIAAGPMSKMTCSSWPARLPVGEVCRNPSHGPEGATPCPWPRRSRGVSGTLADKIAGKRLGRRLRLAKKAGDRRLYG